MGFCGIGHFVTGEGDFVIEGFAIGGFCRRRCDTTQLNEQLRTQVINTSMSASIQSILHNRLQYANIVN